MLATGTALADDADRERATARAHYQEASANYARREYTKACELFAESFRLVPAYAPLFGIAKCQAEVDGNLLAAQGSYERAKTFTTQSPDHEELDRRIAELDARIPRVSVEAPTLTGSTAGVTLYQADTAVAQGELGEWLRVNPGPYRLVAITTDGRRQVTAEFHLKEAERRKIEVTFAPEPRPTRPAPPQPQPVQSETRDRTSDKGHWAYLVGGTALAAIGTGLLVDGVRLGIKMQSKVDDMQRPGIDDASYNRFRQEAIDLRNSAVVLDVVGGAAAVAGTLSLLNYFRAFPFRSAQRASGDVSSRIGTAISPTGVRVFGSW